ncbi:TonB-dependent siderophore receptor [Scytonema sp. UIC 10036]|uniref:TonB-dependent siderophore receptor n=1 Tax=Scytonema sp. UIC 10036 TaxID=2304196 RepID=UPI0012DA742A|nr:TonB-dependent siderophore receptor [Scytonema sp. UIC 10036]MUG96476.1 TonB-dependent siderophore receptor [Scytonema sp. UIC 10036]
MKLDKLFQSLHLTGAVILLIGTPAICEEVREDGIGEYYTATGGKSTLDEKVGVTDEEFALPKAGVAIAKSPVLTPSTRKPRLKESQIANLLPRAKANEASKNIPRLSEIKLPATSARMLVQTPSPTNSPNPEQTNGDQVVPITGVKANPTPKGVEVILETTAGTQLQVINRSTGNNFIADVSGGQLRLPSGDAFTFRSEKPIAGITQITVTNIDANTVRVTVVGEKALPTVELLDDNAGLVFAVASTATSAQTPETPTEEQPNPSLPSPSQGEGREGSEQPAAQQDEPIELVVTGEQDSYNVPNASTGTRTDTPLRDIPQSIQVVPRQVLEDRNVNRLSEALETVSGVTSEDSGYGISGGARILRGFRQVGNFRNGFPQGNEFYTLEPVGTIERVEVLKGPASVLFGSLEPGGIVNTVTKKPLSEPYYKIELQAGNRSFFQPIIDFSGPLTTDKKVLYRLIAGYENSDDVRDFVNFDQISVAPSITVNFSERTNLDLYYEFTRTSGNLGFFAPAILREDSSLLSPRNFLSTYPSLDEGSYQTQKFGYTFKHSFNDNLQLRNNLAVTLDRYEQNGVLYGELRDDRFLVFTNGFGQDSFTNRSTYFGQIDLLAKFKTGSISHQVVVGFDADISEVEQNPLLYDLSGIPDLDIFNPNYDIPTPGFISPNRGQDVYAFDSYGVYLQDQIEFSDSLKFLIGGRYDWVSTDFDLTVFGDGRTQRSDEAFSPRLGLVYQPSETVSLYASYSRSFRPSFYARSADGERSFEPTRGTQYEVGVKAEFLDGRLSTTLAAYHLTRTNVLTPDPDPIRAAQGFSVQTGEQRSQGIELDIAGEILPGWKVIGSYTYTDAEVTKDNSFPVGNQLDNVPEHQASLWTTYEIQEGDLKGLGFGLGLFYVGKRQGDLANSFQLDDYFRTDAAIFYKRDGFRAAINVRNLFDTDYVTYAEGRIFPVVRGKPFTIVGSVSWEF